MLISLDEQDRTWLHAVAAREGTDTTELLRRAVKLLREREGLEHQPFDELPQQTRGLWRGGDGIEYQTRLRHEW